MGLIYWACIQTKSTRNAEFQVEATLTQKGYTVYLPRKPIDRRPDYDRQYAVAPLWPTYLFFRVIEGETEIHPVKKTPGVLKLLHLGGELAKATDKAIELIKAQEDSQGVHYYKHDYSEDDPVRFKSGAWQGYEAVIVGLKGQDRAILETVTGVRLEAYLRDVEPVN